MSLPHKLLPAQYAAWKVLDYSRPFKVVPVATEAYTPPGTHPRVVSSVYGKIDTLVFYYPGLQEERTLRKFCYTEFMIELVAAMKSYGRTFIIVVERGYQLSDTLINILEEKVAATGNYLEILYIDYKHRTLSPWIQDAFLPIQYQLSNGTVETYLVESAMNKVNESANAMVQASQDAPTSSIKGLEYQKSNLPFVGGNVLAGDDFILIGLHDSNEATLKELADEWVGDYILLSSELPPFLASWPRAKITKDGVWNFMESKSDDQIIYHIDLFITLAGKGVRRQKTEFIVVGEPCVGFNGLEEASEDIKELVTNIIEETKIAINSIVQQIEEGMKRLGKRYQIIRNPLPLSYFDLVEEKDGQDRTVRYFSWATYNNCLVEQYKEKDELVSRVFLPSYAGNYSDFPKDEEQKYGNWEEFKQFDHKNKALWEERLGYEVVLLESDYNPFVKHQGSLNCLTNCIVRKK